MWFRSDLRINDNTALWNALSHTEDVVLVFNINPTQIIEQSSMNQQAFFSSVLAFKNNLKKQGIVLNILYGTPRAAFSKLKAKLPQWTDVYFNMAESGFGFARDQEVAKFFTDELGVKSHQYLDYTLHSVNDVTKPDGQPYKMFTPYYHQWCQLPKPSVNKLFSLPINQYTSKAYFENQKRLISLSGNPGEDRLKMLGSNRAQVQLTKFIKNGLEDYDNNRDFPSLNGTSQLSKFIRTGEISIRTIYHAVAQLPESQGQQTFIKELCWRDFYQMIYAKYPNQKEQAIIDSYRHIDWRNNEQDFELWKAGQTGYPIIDAAMRQLNTTGWMHNRLRMLVASFLTKDLLIDWRWGEKYFQQCLIDYDPASNIGGWQWAASTGTDSAPYFRIFNPTTQAKRYDPQGAFIKKYLPELTKITNNKIFDPSRLTQAEQEEFGVVLGKDYPMPIVDHQMARNRAIMAYEISKDR